MRKNQSNGNNEEPVYYISSYIHTHKHPLILLSSSLPHSFIISAPVLPSSFASPPPLSSFPFLYLLPFIIFLSFLPFYPFILSFPSFSSFFPLPLLYHSIVYQHPISIYQFSPFFISLSFNLLSSPLHHLPIIFLVCFLFLFLSFINPLFLPLLYCLLSSAFLPHLLPASSPLPFISFIITCFYFSFTSLSPSHLYLFLHSYSSPVFPPLPPIIL